MSDEIIFYSQANQDKWVCEVLDFKKRGYYVDIGAYDGIQTSNTYTLEKYLRWSGICIEANNIIFDSLVKNRNSKNINSAITNFNGTCHFEGDSIKTNGKIVNCFTLESVLQDNNSPSEIDYLSIDVEGHEYTILNCFDFNKYNIKLMTVEHNLYVDGDVRKNQLFELLTNKGFTRVLENAVCLDKNPLYYNKPYEDWYINSSFQDLIQKSKWFKQ